MSESTGEHIYDRVALVSVLRFHQPRDSTTCACGWHSPTTGSAHPLHVADVYEEVLLNG